MIRRLIVAAVVGFFVFLIFAFIGILLSAAGVPILEDAGKFSSQWAPAIGLAAAVLSFITGWDPFTGIRNG